VSNGLIVAHYLSEDRKADGEIAPHLIKQVGKNDSITASRVYTAANDQLKEGGQIKIHPRTNTLSPLQMKQLLDSEISTSNQSMKTVCYPRKEHQVTIVKVKLKTCSFDIKN
jgi:hypothetical protein